MNGPVTRGLGRLLQPQQTPREIPQKSYVMLLYRAGIPSRVTPLPRYVCGERSHPCCGANIRCGLTSAHPASGDGERKEGMLNVHPFSCSGVHEE